LTQALNINLTHDGQKVDTGDIRIYSNSEYNNFEITAAKRIGISAAKDLFLRFYIKENIFISKK
jgi:3-methyladenine DNA glycosylase Mpg